MKVEVLSDKIIVQKIDIEQKSEGGIILGSEIEKERETAYGKVIQAGEGRWIDNTGPIPVKIKKGDIIAFNERIPRRVTYLGNMYYILRETDADFIVKDKNITEKPYELEGYEYDKGVTKKLS